MFILFEIHIKKNEVGGPCGKMVKTLACEIVGSEVELHSRY